MRRFLYALFVLVVVAFIALPAVAMAVDAGSPPGYTFGVDPVTFGILAGVVVATSAYAIDMLKLDAIKSPRERKSAKLAVVLVTGLVLMMIVRFFGLEHWSIGGLGLALTAAGYHKLIRRE